MSSLLEVRDLRAEFPTHQGVVHAIRGVSLTVSEGEVVGVVGESGSGKTVFLRSLLGLVPSPGRIVGGEIRFDGSDLLKATAEKMRRLRGGEIALIPQDPVNAFNPALTVGFQLVRALKLRRKTPPELGWNREAEMILKKVGIESEDALKRHPFRFSQGQLQRCMTAMAVLTGRPRLLLADEPTTSLDVTIGAQILWLISQLQREMGLAVILVTHDLGVIARLSDRIMVMRDGAVVESGTKPHPVVGHQCCVRARDETCT